MMLLYVVGMSVLGLGLSHATHREKLYDSPSCVHCALKDIPRLQAKFWMYGCMDAWIYGCADVRTDVWIYGCMNAWMYGRVH